MAREVSIKGGISLDRYNELLKIESDAKEHEQMIRQFIKFVVKNKDGLSDLGTYGLDIGDFILYIPHTQAEGFIRWTKKEHNGK